ncbi:MAG: 50S ribosomal protein L6 [Phycisphaerae bacterium]|nr:50S ribosomal protein L6 [Phycisphaerae bacterium]
MSRIGRKPIAVPANVKVSIKDRVISVSGPGGTLKMTHRPEVAVTWEESEKAIKVTADEARISSDPSVKAYWGTTRALIANMVKGVQKDYEETMEIVGVGWQASVQGKQIKLVVGFANPIFIDIPAGVKVTVDKTFVRVSGADGAVVGQFAADMRAARKPEPYNGKGVKYVSEVITRKSGKQFGA